MLLFFQLIVEGMLVQRKLIFVTQPVQYVSFFAKQIYECDHDYQHYPPLPKCKWMKIGINQLVQCVCWIRFHYLFGLLNFN